MRETNERKAAVAAASMSLLLLAAVAFAEGAFHLVEVPAAAGKSMPQMAVHLSGDGGWAVTDKGLSRSLAEHGIPVVGFNSLRYFWVKRTPTEASKEFAKILKQYMASWKKQSAVLTGYSFGAEVLPFMISRLPGGARSDIRLVVLAGPSSSADFEIHVKNMFGGKAPSKDSLPVKPEIEKLRGMNILCIYGADDKASLCPKLDKGLAKVIKLEGGHIVGSDYQPIVKAVMKELK
jgi:type IV secretory pathway VirJ component